MAKKSGKGASRRSSTGSMKSDYRGIKKNISGAGKSAMKSIRMTAGKVMNWRDEDSERGGRRSSVRSGSRRTGNPGRKTSGRKPRQSRSRSGRRQKGIE